jgi:hypothetical protein
MVYFDYTTTYYTAVRAISYILPLATIRFGVMLKKQTLKRRDSLSSIGVLLLPSVLWQSNIISIEGLVRWTKIPSRRRYNYYNIRNSFHPRLLDTDLSYSSPCRRKYHPPLHYPHNIVGDTNISRRHSRSVVRKAKKNDEDDGDDDTPVSLLSSQSSNNGDRMNPSDIEKEEQSSKQLFQRLLIFDTIGKAWNVALYSFIILGIVLNIFGYAYVPQPGQILPDIGTREERQFQFAIRNSMKQQQQKQQQEIQQQQQQQQQQLLQQLQE